MQRTTDLSLTGRMFLWTLRHWAVAQRSARDLPDFVLRTLDQLPDDVAAHIEAVLALVTVGAKRPLQIARPERQTLTADERTLTLSLVAVRLGLIDEVRCLLAEHQHRANLRGGQRALVALDARLQQHGLAVTAEPAATCLAPSPAPAHLADH